MTTYLYYDLNEMIYIAVPAPSLRDARALVDANIPHGKYGIAYCGIAEEVMKEYDINVFSIDTYLTKSTTYVTL